MEREERLTRAVEQYGQELLRYCHHILCDYHEAQDAVQTAFLKAWERADSLPVGGGAAPLALPGLLHDLHGHSPPSSLPMTARLWSWLATGGAGSARGSI